MSGMRRPPWLRSRLSAMGDRTRRQSGGSLKVAVAALAALVVAGLWADGLVDWTGLAGWLRSRSGPELLAGAAVLVLLTAVGTRLTRPERPRAAPVRPLPPVVVGLALVVVAGVTLGIARWLIDAAAGVADPVTARTDAIRTALAVGAGVAGAVTLLFAARRQWLGERAQAHLEVDATEKRVTELYGKAADQLGSETAPVRLAGLYALERLGNQNPNYRQTIVDVVCAYLRMPYDHESGDAQERQVRLTAQEILTMHLRPPSRRSEDSLWPGDSRRRHLQWRETHAPGREYWSGMKLNLAGATLIDLELMDCRIAGANFANAKFVGTTLFSYTEFTRDVDFGKAEFAGEARFRWAAFGGRANFEETVFRGDALFGFARLDADPFCARFVATGFTGVADFDQARFSHMHFAGVTFHQSANFRTVRTQSGKLADLTFHGYADFNGLKTSSRSFLNVSGLRFRPDGYRGLPSSWPKRETPDGDETWVEFAADDVTTWVS